MKDEKRLARLRQSQASVSPEELESILGDWGFELQSVSGSHRQYRHRTGEKLSIPYRRPLKPVYVRLALAAIDRARGTK